MSSGQIEMYEEITESKELRAARALYMAKLTKHGALSIPPSIHYTAGYKDGSAILLDVAKTCAEAERRLATAEARYEALHNAARRCLRYDGVDPARFNEAMRHMDALIQRHIAEIIDILPGLKAGVSRGF